MSNFSSQEVSLEKIENFLKDLQLKWESKNPGGNSWLFLNVKALFSGTIFIVNSLDEAVKFVENLFAEGKDKKAVVMTIINQLFDSIIMANLPVWFMPFSSVLKKLVVDLLLDYLVDFIVDKYNEGVWGTEEEKKMFA